MAREIGNDVKLEARELKLFNERLEKISHEFRTPLNIIIGFSELLLDEVPGKINDEQRHSLNDILNSGRRLLTLLNDYLEKPRTDSAKEPAHR